MNMSSQRCVFWIFLRMPQPPSATRTIWLEGVQLHQVQKVAETKAGEDREHRSSLEHFHLARSLGKPLDLIGRKVVLLGLDIRYALEVIIEVGVDKMRYISLLNQCPEGDHIPGCRVLIQQLAGPSVDGLCKQIFTKPFAQRHRQVAKGAYASAEGIELPVAAHPLRALLDLLLEEIEEALLLDGLVQESEVLVLNLDDTLCHDRV